MSEQQDRSSKTEEATPRRIEEALEKGNSPYSREPGNIAFLITIGLVLPVTALGIAGSLVPFLSMFMDRPQELRLETPQDVVALFWAGSWHFGAAVGPVALALAVAGTFAALIQNKPRIATQRIKPQASRLSPAKGLERIFGAVGLVEFLKALAKMTVAGAAVYWLVIRSPERILVLALTDSSSLILGISDSLSRLFLGIGVVMLTLAIIDILWTRAKWRVDLRMTRKEVKDEQKQMEGDPMVRARQRSVARTRARRRMIAAIPKATVVVVNPTHFAVALRYVQGETAAPVVIAKGVDHLALRIREEAEKHAIPVFEDRDLARTLHAAVGQDRPIPPELYRAVAEVILHVMTRARAPWAA